LNQECEKINYEKKMKIMEKSAKQGISLDQSQINILEMQDMLDESSSSGDDDEDEVLDY
jgi:hypothetical protein